MNLHQIKGRPQWEDTAGHKHNRWQKIAARSGGILTPGNFFTVAGLLLALYGLTALLQHEYWTGLAALAAGRLMDLADGMAAESTATKSPLGEALDAGCDKLITVLTVLVLFGLHIAPWYVLALLLLPHVVIGMFALSAMYQGRRLHPSRIGKLSMAAAWLGLGGLVLLAALDYEGADYLAALTYACLGISFVLGCWALFGYRRLSLRTSEL